MCVCLLLFLVTAPFDPLRRAVHYFSCWWGYHYMQINPFWRITYEGKANIDSRKTYVLAANHQSLADILLIYGLYKPFKWVSKDEILKVPFIGWNTSLNQYVTLNRSDLKSIKEMLKTCREWLNRGASVMIFPEGTRSPDGNLLSFRDGAFKLSIDCNVELVPIVIDGSLDMLAKGSKTICFKKRVKIKVLPPVDPKQFDGSSGKMRAYVHKLMSDTLVEMRVQDTVPKEHSVAQADKSLTR